MSAHRSPPSASARPAARFVPDHPAARAGAFLLGLTALGMFAFGPLLHSGFAAFDDEAYVTKNLHVQRGFTASSLRWAWTAGYAANWHPLTWMSHLLDWSLFGAWAPGHHLSSLLLHLANTLLLFALLDRMTRQRTRSAFVAALFAVHPLHVESVAWVAERKDVLSTTFWMLAIFAYVRYVERRTVLRYALVLIAMALGLTAKPMLVTLPFTLWLLDDWPLGRWRRRRPGRGTSQIPWDLLWEKVPLLALSAASCVVTYRVQRAGRAMGLMNALPLSERVANAVVSYARYLGSTVLPLRLAVYYPHPGATLPRGTVALSAAILALVTILASRAHSRRPYLLVGWLWFLGTLVPVIGLVQVGTQARADRYTYVPLIGIFLAGVWGLADAGRLLGGRREPSPAADRVRAWSLRTLGGAALVTLAILARLQASHWRDSATLATHALAVTENNFVAHSLLGSTLEARGDRAQAIEQYERALRIAPSDRVTLNQLGAALVAEGRVPRALELYTKALQSDPDDPETNSNLGAALARLGRIDEAVPRFEAALRAKPDLPEARTNLGNALLMKGRADEAARQYALALEVAPDDPDIHNNLGAALARLGRTETAIPHFEAALRSRPGFARAHENWGLALQRLGRWTEALSHFEQAIRSAPADPRPHGLLGAALLRLGRHAEALREARTCRELGGEPPRELLQALTEREASSGVP